MADVEEFAEETPSSPSESPKKKKMMTIIIVAGIMLFEGGGLFVVTRMMYKSPETVEAVELPEEERVLQNVMDEVELALPDMNAFNKSEGRQSICSFQVTVRVRKDKAKEVQCILDARKSTIRDRFNTVIRSAEMKYLGEPGLGTIRRQFRLELEKILGSKELVLELLIPKFFQSAADV